MKVLVTDPIAEAGIDRLREAGVDHFGLLAFDNEERDELASLELFSENVIDAVEA